MNTRASSTKDYAARMIRILGSLLSLALIFLLLARQEWKDIHTALQRLSPGTLFLCLLLMTLSSLCVCGRWYILLRSSAQSTNLAQVVKITFSGLFSTNFLPTTIGGDTVRLAGAVKSGIDFATGAASLIIDRLIGMTGMAMVLPVGIYRLVHPLTAEEIAPVMPFWGLCALKERPSWRAKWMEKIRAEVTKAILAFSLWKNQPLELFKSLAFSWLHMLCIFSILYLLLHQMGESLSFWLISGLYSLVYFVTLFPISLNGYGIQEVSMTYILSELGNASLETSFVVALLFRTLMMFVSLPGAFFAPEILLAIKKAR